MFSANKEPTMGLEVVEFVMEIEEKFGISIPDNEVVYFCTLGQMHDYLLEKCAGRKRSDNPAHAAFDRLRPVLNKVLGVDPEALSPNTPLLPLLGTWWRQQKWKRLQKELGLKLPSLENRAGIGVAWGSLLVGVGSFLAVTVVSHDIFLAFASACIGVLFGVILGYVVGLLLPNRVGASCRTLGDLARWVAALNDRQFPPPVEPSTENDPIWEKLCEIIVQNRWARRETLRRDSMFAEDLGF
jgi:hypothetical protein